MTVCMATGVVTHPIVTSKIDNPVEHNFVSWPEYFQCAIRVARMIRDSGEKFDTILALPRGGMPFADLLTRVFKLPLAVLSTSLYKDDTGKESKVIVSKQISMTCENLGKRVLIVDDMVDSGETMEAVIKYLKERFPNTVFKTAVLWRKECSSFVPDFYLPPLVRSCVWIHQPFERYSPLSLESDDKFIARM